MERTDEAAFANPASGIRSQVRAEMRAIGLSDADASVIVISGNDIFTHPCQLQELRVHDRPPLGDKVLTLWKREQRWFSGAFQVFNQHGPRRFPQDLSANARHLAEIRYLL